MRGGPGSAKKAKKGSGTPLFRSRLPLFSQLMRCPRDPRFNLGLYLRLYNRRHRSVVVWGAQIANHISRERPPVACISRRTLPARSSSPRALPTVSAGRWLPNSREMSLFVMPFASRRSVCRIRSATGSPSTSPKMWRAEASQYFHTASPASRCTTSIASA